MLPLAQARCLLHSQREAAARCPECRQSYCRECITEHDGRVICAACLRRLAHRAHRPSPHLGRLLRPWPVVLGLLISWMVYYSLGRLLLRIPSEWHEGIKAQDILTQ